MEAVLVIEDKEGFQMEVKVWYDFHPAEPMELEYPGCEAYVEPYKHEVVSYDNPTEPKEEWNAIAHNLLEEENNLELLYNKHMRVF